jgi:hypothetical protein
VPRAIVDVSYGRLIPGAEPFESRLRGPLRGLALFAASVRADAIAVVRTGPGWRALLLLRALLGRRRKLVALQFIVHPDRGRMRDRIWDRADVWAVRRALRAGLVLTADEQRACVARYRLPPDRFPLVRWPSRLEAAPELPPPRDEGFVLSSGRAFCDWPTVFAAARGAAWLLTVVCSREDLAEVERLNADGRATVLSEIAAHEHAALLARASVLVVAMREQKVSQGHVRLMDAAGAGVPVVITEARALREYLVPGETALVVPAGDADGLRAAVDRLMADRGERERVRRTAFEHSQRWTGEEYLAAVAGVLGVVGGRRPSPWSQDAGLDAPRR